MIINRALRRRQQGAGPEIAWLLQQRPEVASGNASLILHTGGGVGRSYYRDWLRAMA